MGGRPAAGGGRWVSVAPERVTAWLDGFAQRHGDLRCVVTEQAVAVHAADGALATCTVPFPPLRADPSSPYGGLPAHAVLPRRVGVLLVRRGGFATGIFHGTRLEVSKVGSRPVAGRSAAGGWSQQRFARRREGQARVALDAAADVAVRVLLPRVADLDAVVLGGDRSAVQAVLDDARLAPLRPLVTGPVIDVPEPRLRVLEDAPRHFRAVRVRVVEPAGSGPVRRSARP